MDTSIYSRADYQWRRKWYNYHIGVRLWTIINQVFVAQYFHSVTGCQTNHLAKPDNVKLGLLLRWNKDHLEKANSILEYFSCPSRNLSSVRIKRVGNKFNLLISSFPFLPGLFLDLHEAIPILFEGSHKSRHGHIQYIIPYLTLFYMNKMLTFCRQHLGDHCFK